MSRWTKFLGRDCWNQFGSRLWSRNLRQFWLKRSLSYLGASVSVCQQVTLMDPSGISIGDRTVVNPCCILDGREDMLKISHDVDIGTHTHIWTLQHDPNHPEHGTMSGAVVIEDHVWIASRVTILPGVTIGRGAVVAAGAVVSKDVAPMLSLIHI